MRPAREGPGTSIHSILLRPLTRVLPATLCTGIALLVLGYRLQKPVLKVSGWVVLGISFILLCPIAAFLAAAYLGPAARSFRDRTRLARALRALDAAEKSSDPGAFRAACAHIREMFGAAVVDQRLREVGRPSREMYLSEATAGAVEELATRPEDPLAPRAWLEAMRRRNLSVGDLSGANLGMAWRTALARANPFEVPRETGPGV